MSERWRRSDLAVAVIVTSGVLGPAILKPGYVLRGDMVFAPGQPWKPAWLGLDGGVPRSVPMDAIVWLFGQVLPGDVVQKGLLAASLVVLALGIARLLSRVSAAGRVAGMVLACWNPWVYERLAIGQWACVLGLAALPWLLNALAQRRFRAAAAWLLVAGVAAPSMGLTAVLMAVAVAIVQRCSRLEWLVLIASCVAANVPWIAPSLLRTGLDAPSGQFSGFAASSESSAGLLASVLSLGGVWKTSVVPAERTSAVIVLAAAVVSVASLVVLYRGRKNVPAVAGLLIAAAISLLIGLAVLSEPLSDVARAIPAVGILRDSTRYLAPLVLAVALGFGLLVHEVVSRARPAIVLALLPIALLPSMAWGLHGFLEPTRYPSSWFEARSVMQRDGVGATVVLPWRGSYRGYPWTGAHAVLDPAPRFFPGDVWVDDRTFLTGGVIASEDPYLRSVGRALAATDPSSALRALGIRWVLIERGPRLASGPLPAGRTAFASTDLSLIDLGMPTRGRRSEPSTGWVLAADLGAVLTLFLVFLRRSVTGVTVRRTDQEGTHD